MDQDRGAVEDFFADHPLGLQVLDAVGGVVDDLGPASVRVSRTQVAVRRRVGFAFVWMPGSWLRRPGAEVVLSISLLRRDDATRWKEVVQVSRQRWMHHLEVHAVTDLDDPDLRLLLAEAYDAAA